MTDCEPDCTTSRCDNAFAALFPFPTVQFGTRISWQMRSGFRAAGPLRFQLQVGRTELNTADDWQNVGSVVVDGYYAYDDTKRVYGQDRWTSYRVVLTDGDDNVYYSRPINVADTMKTVTRNRILGIERFWLTRARSRSTSAPMIEFYILKRRLFGEACPDCLDYQTGDSTDDNCPTCFGTKIVDGYYDPEGCVYGELQPASRRTAVDPELRRGTLDLGESVTVTMLGAPRLMQNDVLVARKSDERYYVHKITEVSLVESIAVMVDVEIRSAPYSDIIYSFEIPEQVP